LESAADRLEDAGVSRIPVTARRRVV